ncbi:MAG: hypothetical protein QXN87_09110 [Candidatus Bathyarchaeia archaeon]
MKSEELKTLAVTINELSESYVDLLQSLKGTIRQVKATKQLWKDGRKPILIKLGLALIVFPEPAVSDVLGSILIAAGTLQEGVRRRALYLEDVPKTFHNVIKEIQATKGKVIKGLG